MRLDRDAKRTPASELAWKPTSPAARAVLLTMGTLMLALGIIGVYLPGLPTTPFLLLAAACYVRSSPRLFHWLVSHPRLGPPLRTFFETRALSRRVKVISLLVAWAVLGALALFVVRSTLVKTFLIGLALAKTVLMLSLPTLERQAGCPPSVHQ